MGGSVPYTELLSRTGRILWRHKSLSLLGLGYVIGGGIIGLIMQIWSATNPMSAFFRTMTSAPEPERFLFDQFTTWTQPLNLVLAVVAIFAYTLLVWILAAISEASLIQAVAAETAGRPLQLSGLLRAAWHSLGRLIAIDTLVYFPLFLVSLAILLISSGGLIGFILYVSAGSVTQEWLIIGGMAIWLLLMVLFFASFLIGLVTVFIRQLAFRAAVLNDLPLRPAIRHAVTLFRRHWLQMLAVLLLIYAISQVIGMLVGFLAMPAQMFNMFRIMQLSSGPAPPDPFIFLEQPLLVHVWMILVTLAGLAVSTLTTTFSSVFWTLCYQHWDRHDTDRD